MKSNIFSFILLAFIFSSCTTPTTVSVQSQDRDIAAVRCEQLFQNKTADVKNHEGKEHKENTKLDYVEFYREHSSDIGEANQLLMKRILLRSTQLESQLVQKEIKEYDFILIGAGIHTGIVMSQIKEKVPNAKILILEKSKENLSVFGRTGETFYGNTLESEAPGSIHSQESNQAQLKADSRNYMPNAPIQTYDLARGKIPQASEFAAPVIATYDKYKPDVLFNINIDQIIPHKDGISVKLPRGMGVVRAKMGGIGIGLGEANVPAMSSASRQFVRTGKHTGFIEDVLEQAQQAKTDPWTRELFVNRFKDKDISLLGGGHGAAIVIDLLLGYGPADFYAAIPLEKFKPKSITWVGLKDPKGRPVTGEIFKEFIGGGQRYNHLAAHIDDRTIKVVSQNAFIERGQTKAVSLNFWNKDLQEFEKGADGKKIGIDADFVAYAAGYNYNPIAKMLTQFGAKETSFDATVLKGNIEPNDSRMTRENVNLGKEVLKHGKPSGVFLYGPSAGAIAEAADPGGVASPVINVMASRSKAMGDYLVNKLKAD